MAIRNGKIERMIQAPSAGYAFTVNEGSGNVVVTVTGSEKSFWSSAYSGSGGSGSTFPVDIQDHLLDEMSDSYTVTIDAAENGTGKVTITNTNTNNFTVTWTNTNFRDLLGFTGDLSGASSYTSQNQVQGLWLPNAPMNSLFGANDKGFFESDATATESPSGHVKSFYANRKQVNQIRWAGVTHAKCRASAESTVNESYEQFWLDCILGEKEFAVGPAGPIRIYWDAGNNSQHADYRTVGNSLMNFNPEKMEEGWLGLWVIDLDRLVLVP